MMNRNLDMGMGMGMMDMDDEANWHVSATSVDHFLWISDIHLDLKFGEVGAAGLAKCSTAAKAEPSPFGCETSVTLLEDALMRLDEVVGDGEEPAFALITGDMNRHDMENVGNGALSLFEEAIEKVSLALRESFVDIPIVYSLGNDDCFPNYHLDPQILNKVHGLIRQPFGLTEDQSQTFLQGGYMRYDMTSDFIILSLNTNLFSDSVTGSLPASDAESQLKWLESNLQQCRQNNSCSVWIIGHIPPTNMSYQKGVPLWQAKYAQVYHSILQNYQDVITAQLFGHIHTSEFRLISNTQDQNNNSNNNSDNSNDPFIDVPMFMTSAITPYYDNLPNYRMVSFHNHIELETPYRIVDFTTHVYNTTDQTWFHPPSFQRAYFGDELHPVLDATTMHKHIVQPMLSNNSDTNVVFDTFMYRLKYNPPSDICDTFACRVPWACTLISNVPQEYTDCVQHYLPNSSPPESRFIFRTNKAAAVILIILVFALMALVVGAIIRVIKRRKKQTQHRTALPRDIVDDNLWNTDTDDDEPNYQSTKDGERPWAHIT